MPDVRKEEIASEQQVVDRVYERIEGMREQAQALAKEGYGRANSGPRTGLVERDAIVLTAAKQLHALDAEHEGLVFGRLDFDDGEIYHIGRLGVRDDNREPLLVDWRAPAAAPFYRATSGDPLGVVRRRVIISRGPKVIDLDDDVLMADAAGDLKVLGEGALLAALQRARGPQMRDIVTTIQREQDEAIRAPARGVTLITGGPGTGKTQVALHRAAYLLYTDRAKFADGRVLVIGPSTVFTNYISRVLPGLGEDSVQLRALGELFEGVVATRRDPAEVAAIKGSVRMCAVLTELMWQTPPGAPDRLRLMYAGQVLTLDADELAAARQRVRSAAQAPNTARKVAVEVLLDALWTKVDGEHLDRELFRDEVADRNEFRRFLAGWWPALTPTRVLLWLADPARAKAALSSADPERAEAAVAQDGAKSAGDPARAKTRGGTVSVLGDEEAAEILARSYRDGDWTVDDVPLLDELSIILGEVPVVPKADPGIGSRLRELTIGPQKVDTFVLSCTLQDGWSLYAPGHPTPIALAGPAMDNNAMFAAQQWAKAVILREGHHVVSWTDGFDPYGEDGYVPVLAEPLPVAEPEDQTSTMDDYAHVILDEAQDLSPMECRMIARQAAYASMTIVGDLGQATHPLAAGAWPQLMERLGRREVRTLELRTGYRVPQVIMEYAAQFLDPEITPTHSYRPGGELTRQRVDDLQSAVRQAIRDIDGAVAVIAPDRAVASLCGIAGATVYAASEVKGLEFDHVIVVEPAEIVAAEPRGRQRLYVVLTRAVASLTILHTGEWD